MVIITEKDSMLKPIFNGIKAWCFKYIGSMFMESRVNGTLHMSIGRVLLAIAAGFSLYVWVYRGSDIPSGMQVFLMANLSYVLGSKINNTVKSALNNNNRPQASEVKNDFKN